MYILIHYLTFINCFIKLYINKIYVNLHMYIYILYSKAVRYLVVWNEMQTQPSTETTIRWCRLSFISLSRSFSFTHTLFPLLLSLFLFQSDYRPRNLIKLRLPSGALAKNQWAFTRQIKRTTASGYFYTANSNTQHTLHYILIMFGFDWFAWVYVYIMYIYIILYCIVWIMKRILEQKVVHRVTVHCCMYSSVY